MIKKTARRRINLLEELVDFTTQLPWWIGIVLALASWAGLHWLAGAATPAPRTALALQNVALPFSRGLITMLQYVLPALFLAGAAMSLWLRWRSRHNYAAVAADHGQGALEGLSWREFENLVAEFFRRKGFTVEQRGGGVPGGGVDLVASIGEDRYLVQCKHWRVQRVGVAVVRAICEIAAAEGAAGVFVVTSGSFTDEARKFVFENRIDIELISGERLQCMIRGLAQQARAGNGGPREPA